MQLWDCIRRYSPRSADAYHADSTSCVYNVLSEREALATCLTAHLMNLQDRVYSLLFSGGHPGEQPLAPYVVGPQADHACPVQCKVGEA